MGSRALTVQDFVLSHAVRVPVTTEADDHQSLLLAHNSLIDMPACGEMGEDERHCGVMPGDEADDTLLGNNEPQVVQDDRTCFEVVEGS